MANQRSTEYEPRTLKTNDGIRRAILPAYPPSSNEEVPNLLLANVPGIFSSASFPIDQVHSSLVTFVRTTARSPSERLCSIFRLESMRFSPREAADGIVHE
jgi:hypothetical protein